MLFRYARFPQGTSQSVRATLGAAQSEETWSEAEGFIPLFPVAMRPGATPVPIPNTTVKTQTADGTMLETAWESRWLPDY